MYNEVKINMLSNDCDCEYALSMAGGYVTPFVYLNLYIGEGVERPHVRLWVNGTSDLETWNATEFTPPDYKNGWYRTRLKYEDFLKCGEYELNAVAYDGDTRIGNRTLLFVHNGKLQSSGEWMVEKPTTSWNNNVYVVTQVGTSSSGGSSGGGSGAIYAAGDGINISEENAINAKIGNGLQFVYEQNEDGTDNIEKPRKIAVKIGKGLALLEDGTIVSVPNIQNAVILQEAEASYLLHEYKEVEYIAGNTIGYAGPTSKIVCQGYVFDSLTPDKYTIGADVLYGTSLNIRLATSATAVPSNADVHIDAEYDASDTSKAHCYLVCSAANYRSTVGYYYDGVFGIYFKWDSIHVPNDNFPYGYVKGKAMMPGKAAKNATNFYNASQLCFTAYFPFATEAEYNAAVGLTYEPITLTEVQETVTEV